MASYTKLRSGDWGVRGEGAPPAVGDSVTVEKKSGETEVRTVSRVFWSGPSRDGSGLAWIAAVQADRAPSQPRRRTARRSDNRTAYERGDRSRGARNSHYDRMGLYAHDGTKLASGCQCIDYPCCGH